MTAHTCRLLTALLALTLVVGGCTLGRTRTTTVAPRDQPSVSALSTDVQALRNENERLRRQQDELQSRLGELQRTLAGEREEHQRFRESMRTNFDLLEQSVALTLSKTVTADMRRQDEAQRGPSMAPAPAQGPAQVSAPAQRPQAEGSAQEAAAKAQAASASAAPGGSAAQTAMARPSKGSAQAMATPVAMRSGREDGVQAVEDPDLLPPQSPTMLSAHREAKALYEKGFALFARKEYDQAVIVFRNFLNRFPDDIYSDNAQFWIAESYLNMSRSNEAEDAYRAVLRNYEHRSTLEGFKTPDAIYRLGQLYHDRGDSRRARHYFQVLGERFPDTSAGRKAQRELSSLSINTAAR